MKTDMSSSAGSQGSGLLLSISVGLHPGDGEESFPPLDQSLPESLSPLHQSLKTFTAGTP